MFHLVSKNEAILPPDVHVVHYVYRNWFFVTGACIEGSVNGMLTIKKNIHVFVVDDIHTLNFVFKIVFYI